MIEKELREIKRRFRPEKSNIPRIVGCLVNENKEIVSKISQPLAIGDSIVTEKLLSVIKKTLSGSLGTNLTDMEFSTKEVTDSPCHKLLMDLRATGLKDQAVLDRFYTKVIESLTFDHNYVVLLANDVYDVFTYGSDGESSDSQESFSYIICAICPVKTPPEALSFKESDSLFHTVSPTSLLSAPDLGFMFPAFDDRKTNIYGALYYVKSVSESYPEFTAGIFGKDSPMPPKLQKATFNACLCDTLSEECSYDVVRSLHQQMSEMVLSHKESHDPEPLKITKSTVRSVLESCGIANDKIEKIGQSMDESFGESAELSPKNIVSVNKFELTTPNVSIKVDPEHKDLVSTQLINGVQYILIRATDGVEVNGIKINTENVEE